MSLCPPKRDGALAGAKTVLVVKIAWPLRFDLTGYTFSTGSNYIAGYEQS